MEPLIKKTDATHGIRALNRKQRCHAAAADTLVNHNNNTMCTKLSRSAGALRRTSFTDSESDDRPITPEKDDCCGNSCNPCIFDVHKKLLEEWEKKKLNKSKIPPDKNYLSLTRYSRFIVKDIIEASKDCIYILLVCESENKEDVLFLFPSQHIMIKLNNTSKPYTPISWSQRDIKLLVKLYPNSKVSASIKELKKGDDLFIRGPYGDFKYQRNSYKHIVMFEIGSGIAATYPLAVSIVEDELEDTKIYMAAGFRSSEHVPLKNELRLLTDFWNFECTLYLSQESTVNITGINIVNSRLNEAVINKILDSFSSDYESTLVLICGTPEFNQSVEKIVREKQFSHCHVFR